jgi:CoA:oxalate CoA-transferase
MFAALAILGSLMEVKGTQTGRTIDVSMQDRMVALLTYRAAITLNKGGASRTASDSHPSIAPYGTFEAADGQFNLCVGTDDQFARLCHALLGSQFVDDPRFATNTSRCENRDALERIINEAVGSKSTDGVLRILADAKVPAGAVRSVQEALHDRCRVSAT